MRFLCRGLRVLAVLAPLPLAGGCYLPLALQDAYFAPGSAAARAHHAEALDAVRHGRAVQQEKLACAGAAAADRVCAGRPPPVTAADGGIANAYRRWTEDKVRTLPKASATAAGAAGDG